MLLFCYSVFLLLFFCVCVCVCARARTRARVCVYVSVTVCVCMSGVRQGAMCPGVRTCIRAYVMYMLCSV